MSRFLFIFICLVFLSGCLTSGITGQSVEGGAEFTLPPGEYLISSSASITSFEPSVCEFNTLINGSQDMQLECSVDSLTVLFVETNDFICAVSKGAFLQQDVCLDLLEPDEAL